MDTPKVKVPTIAPIQFLKEVIAELKKVTWPTRAETIQLTAVVVVVSLGVALYIGGLDFLFLTLETQFLK